MTFPALAPTTRVFTPGNVPQALQMSLNGTTSGFRRGNRRIDQSLSLSFGYLTEADLNLIKMHYFDRKGTFDIFFLSPEIWGDYTTPPVPLLSDVAWRYASPPTITDVGIDRYTVDIELVSLPIDITDLIIDGGLAPATPVRDYIVDGGSASATPARDYVISPPGAA